jgi:hypothetical protein
MAYPALAGTGPFRIRPISYVHRSEAGELARLPGRPPARERDLERSESGDDEPLRPAIPDDYLIDEPEIEKIAPLLIQDADASQLSSDFLRDRLARMLIERIMPVRSG